MAGITLYDYQKDALERMKIGCILCGGVGSGKSRTSLAFYYTLYGGTVNTKNYVKMHDPPDLYIITTARKRDTGEWEEELAHFYINAADLADIGVDTDRLDFLKETYVLSEPHGIENWLPCTKEVIPLHELDEKDFTFGETTSKLSSLQAANFGTAGKAWNAIQSTIGYLNTK